MRWKRNMPRRDGRFGGPVIRVAAVCDLFVVLALLDQIRAACHRRHSRYLVEWRTRAVRFHAPLRREDRQVTRDQRCIAARFPEVEAHCQAIDHARAVDVRELRVVDRRDLMTGQRVVRILHIGGGDRVAIGKTRVGIDMECGRLQSGATSTSSAINGYSEASSSQLRCISVSNIRFFRSGAGAPRTRKGFIES